MVVEMSQIEDALTEINEAISAIQNGAQSYKIGQQSVTKANLATLYAERQRLENKLAVENSGDFGAGVFQAHFLGR